MACQSRPGIRKIQQLAILGDLATLKFLADDWECTTPLNDWDHTRYTNNGNISANNSARQCKILPACQAMSSCQASHEAEFLDTASVHSVATEYTQYTSEPLSLQELQGRRCPWIPWASLMPMEHFSDLLGFVWCLQRVVQPC